MIQCPMIAPRPYNRACPQYGLSNCPMPDRSARRGNGSPMDFPDLRGAWNVSEEHESVIRAGHQFALTTLTRAMGRSVTNGLPMRFAVQIATLLLVPMAAPAAAQDMAS